MQGCDFPPQISEFLPNEICHSLNSADPANKIFGVIEEGGEPAVLSVMLTCTQLQYIQFFHKVNSYWINLGGPKPPA